MEQRKKKVRVGRREEGKQEPPSPFPLPSVPRALTFHLPSLRTAYTAKERETGLCGGEREESPLIRDNSVLKRYFELADKIGIIRDKTKGFCPRWGDPLIKMTVVLVAPFRVNWYRLGCYNIK